MRRGSCRSWLATNANCSRAELDAVKESCKCLRAVSSLNQILHPRVIPILLEALRDSNRLVRTRAASALAKFEHESREILQGVVDSRDRYALHAMISALELGGGFEKVMAQREKTTPERGLNPKIVSRLRRRLARQPRIVAERRGKAQAHA